VIYFRRKYSANPPIQKRAYYRASGLSLIQRAPPTHCPEKILEMFEVAF
jgi:hypothetical protein